MRDRLYSLFDEVKEAAAELKSGSRPLGQLLLQPEAHVYAFAIAANVLLAFWPFMLVIISLFRNVIGWRAAELALYIGVKDYFPGDVGSFLAYNLHYLAPTSRRVEWLSLILLLFTANGVFLPLEVALNRAWGLKVNRNLLKNQLVSMGLIFACGGLVVLSAALVGGAPVLWGSLSGQDLGALERQLTGKWVNAAVPLPLMLTAKLAAIPMTILSLFLVYCYLPNTKVPKRAVLPRAVVVGLMLEGLKWVNLAIWPWLFAKFNREFGVFVNSITILTWSFIAALVVLAGGEWTARGARAAQARQEAADATETPIPG